MKSLQPSLLKHYGLRNRRLIAGQLQEKVEPHERQDFFP